MKIILLLAIMLIFSGCIVGTVLSLPIKAVGAIVPGVTGTAIGVAGSAVDTVIPF